MIEYPAPTCQHTIPPHPLLMMLSAVWMFFFPLEGQENTYSHFKAHLERGLSLLTLWWSQTHLCSTFFLAPIFGILETVFEMLVHRLPDAGLSEINSFLVSPPVDFLPLDFVSCEPPVRCLRTPEHPCAPATISTATFPRKLSLTPTCTPNYFPLFILIASYGERLYLSTLHLFFYTRSSLLQSRYHSFS